MIYCWLLFCHSLSCLECLLHVLFPMLIAPSVLGLFGETAQFVIVIFCHLGGVLADDAFRLAKCSGDAPFHCAEMVAVVAFGHTIHCLHKHHGHALGGR